MIIDPVYSGDDGDGDEEEGLIIKLSRIVVNLMTILTMMMLKIVEMMCVSCLNIAFSWNFGRKASGNPNLGWMSAYLDDKIIHVVHILNQEHKLNLNHKIVKKNETYI